MVWRFVGVPVFLCVSSLYVKCRRGDVYTDDIIGLVNTIFVVLFDCYKGDDAVEEISRRTSMMSLLIVANESEENGNKRLTFIVAARSR